MISAIVLAKNEEKNIGECLAGLKWCDEVLVIDDNSEDKTAEIAKKQDAKVIKHSLNEDFSQQRNFGLAQAKSEWILFVDADERVGSQLVQEIQEAIKENGIDGFYLKRQDFFCGKLLKYGEIGAIRLLRLAKKGKGEWKGKVDEIWAISGEIGCLENPLLHHSHINLTQFLESINQRSSMNARMFFEQGKKLNFFEWCKPFCKFMQNYFFRLGFLDGIAGFVFAVLMSFHSFLVRGKLYLLWNKKHV